MKLLRRRRESGQSIPLIALMIVLLFAMVGLSVDVGNTYAEQRSVTRGTNAAAIAAMDAVVKGYSDQAVAQTIRESLASNGIKLDADVGDSRTLSSYYMDIEGKVISNCQIGECASVPVNANYIQVSVTGTVGTYFARVVGRPSLPVNSTSWSGRCPPSSGVYPIGVPTEIIDSVNGRFYPPVGKTNLADYYGGYSDSVYQGKFWRRMELFSGGSFSGVSGNFTLLRWNADDKSSSVPGLAEAFTGAGTLASTFKEVTPQPSSDTPKLSGYPFAPGLLTVGDWIAGSPGAKFMSNDINSALTKLMTDRAVLILPIISKYDAGGANGAFKLEKFGKFYLVDPFPSDSRNGGISPNGGANSYMDLVYLGNANDTPCLVTNVDPVDEAPPTTGTPGTPGIPPTTTPDVPQTDVTIPFELNPRWQTESEPSDPIAYQLVVDVSGSMVWDFYGNGTINASTQVGGNSSGGTNVRCEWSAPENQYTYKDGCSGPTSPWWNYKERRIYTTKDAIRTFINNLGANDTMRYTAFSSGRGYSGNTSVVPTTGYTNNKTTLLSAIDTLGSYNNDPYITNGGTPGPQALQMARSVLTSAPNVAPNGLPYRDVIIYLTDGVANVFLDGQTNTATDICPSSGGWTQNKAQNTPDPCQIGYSSKFAQNRPITEMINQANLLKQANEEAQIYVIALATVATDGLSQVASAPSMMYKANQPGFVGSVMEAIRKRASGATCIANGGSKYIDRIPSANHADLSSPFTLASDEYGKVKIFNENGTSLITEVPITHDATSGKLGIKTALPPGNYQLTAWIGYKGPDEPTPVSRIYQALSWNKVSFSSKISFSVTQDSSLNNSVILPTIYVDLESDKNVCPVN